MIGQCVESKLEMETDPLDIRTLFEYCTAGQFQEGCNFAKAAYRDRRI